MTAKTVSKTDSKYNVKLIAITAMCAALITVTTAFIKIPSPLGYSHAGDSMIYLAASILPGHFRNYRIINRRRSCRPYFGLSALGNSNSYYQGCQRSSVCALQNGDEEAWQR